MDVGTRIRLTTEMRDDPDPVPIGTEGTVVWWAAPSSYVGEQVGVEWDNGRKLGLVCPPDRYFVLEVPNPTIVEPLDAA